MIFLQIFSLLPFCSSSSMCLPKSNFYVYVVISQHADMADESIQLKTLQTILIILQSRLLPENEVIME